MFRLIVANVLRNVPFETLLCQAQVFVTSRVQVVQVAMGHQDSLQDIVLPLGTCKTSTLKPAHRRLISPWPACVLYPLAHQNDILLPRTFLLDVFN
jgi:hypothetical protein